MVTMLSMINAPRQAPEKNGKPKNNKATPTKK